ncbi:MAG: ribulose-phosphate 3-epimerase [Holdemanella sp.]|nr:ribulose-phosphate 3-epimerase [Holdemanella sp.]
MRDIWKKKLIVSPSLITLDMTDLRNQMKLLEENGVEMLHVDILDGHFSPSMPLGLDTVRQLRKVTNLKFECHVMVTEPDFFIDELLDIGVDQIVFHIETAPHVDGLLNKIHAKGVRAGVALKPATPLCELEYILEKCDCVCLMLINPGYASVKGEKQVVYAERKVKELRKMIDERHLDTIIEIDGRVSMDNMRAWGKDDVQIFVGGSTCIKRDDIPGSIQKLKEVRDEVLG